MKDRYAQKDFNKPFDELNQEEKDKLLKDYPDYKALAGEARENMVLEQGEDLDIQLWWVRKMSDAVYNSEIESLAQALLAGQIDYKTYLNTESTLRKIYKGEKKALNEINKMADPEGAKDLAEYLEKQPPEDKALSHYWEIYSNPSLREGIVDWDATEKRQDAFLASLSAGVREYVMRNKNRWIESLPPTARKLAEIQTEGRDIVDDYYDQPEGSARQAYRRENPTIDAWLLIMGRVSVPQTQMALQIAMDLLRGRGLPMTLLTAISQQEPMMTRPAWGEAIGSRPTRENGLSPGLIIGSSKARVR